MYCETPGLEYPTGPCFGGWYCLGAAEDPRPPDDATGGRCTPGHFCPNGSSVESECMPGMYCDSYELSEPTGDCLAGYYCTLGATTATPTDGVEGGCLFRIIDMRAD